MANSSVSDQNHDFTDAQNWFNHGCDLYDLKEYEKAIAAFDKVIEFDSEHFEAWFNRAAILHRLERYEEAITNYTKVIEINPDYSDAWFNRGRIFEYHLENHTNATRPPGHDWANVQVSDRTQANIVAFSSGCGDGAYASYWGYDSTGNLVSLVTDFSLFPSTS